MLDLWNAWNIVVTYALWRAFAIKACSSFKVAIGLLMAFDQCPPCLVIHFGGMAWSRPDLGGTIHLRLINDCLDFAPRDIQGLRNMFYTHHLICAFPQLYPRGLLKAPWVSWLSLLWNSLPSRGNLQEQLIVFWNNQNRCNLTQVEAN